MKRLCRRAWQLCHILPAVAYFQHPFHSGKYPKSCCVFHTVLWKAIFFHTGLLFPSLPLSFSLISPPFSSHIFFPYLIPSSKSNHSRSGEIDFSIMILHMHLLWVAYMTHNWYPDFKTGVEALSWEGRQRTTDGKEREKSPMETRMRKILACDKVADCSAAARLQHIWNTSASWKILQEIREKMGGGEKRGVVILWGPVVTHISAIQLHLPVQTVSFCGCNTGLPPRSSFFSPLPSLYSLVGFIWVILHFFPISVSFRFLFFLFSYVNLLSFSPPRHRLF